MADETPKVAAPKPAALPTKEELSKKIQVVEIEVLKYAGNPKFNPYIWLNQHVAPVRAALAANPTITKELVDNVNALKVPVIK